MRYKWNGELWEDRDWLFRFIRSRDLSPKRNAGTIEAARRNFVRNSKPLLPKYSDFLLAEYSSGDGLRNTAPR